MFILEKTDDSFLQSLKKPGYFLGSFDPLHEGHISVVKKIISEKLCDAVLVYCVNGKSNYKRRSDFFSRTQSCEKAFSYFDNVIISYLSPRELQKKITKEQNGFAVPKFEFGISAIIGSDIVKNLINKNSNEETEKNRQFLQSTFMKGILNEKIDDSILCSIIIPASDFIVALREDDKKEDIPGHIFGKPVRNIIEIPLTRRISSSKIR